MKKQKFNENGFSALLAVLIILSSSSVLIFGFSFLVANNQKVIEAKKKSLKSYYLSEAGVEDAVYRIKSGKQYSSPYNLSLDNGTTTIDISGANTKTITSRSDLSNIFKNIQTVLTISTVNPQFYYGVQIGDGGITMGQNSQVNGSVYSNGSIIGAAGARITGSASVAIGLAPNPDQTWTAYNTNYNAGVDTGSIITTIDSVGDIGEYTSIALGPDNLPRISYIDVTNGDLKFAKCLNDDCSLINIAVVDSVGYVNEVTSLVIGNDTFPRISYYHDGDDDLKFAQCLDDSCGSSNRTVVESTNNVGDFSDLEIGSDNYYARIAYWHDTNKDAKFVRCTNDDCTSKVITSVESSGNVGEYISLELGSDGFGRISYYDASNRDLKFIHCLDVDCSDKNITAVDSDGDVGQYTSLALGTDGFARISYYDVSNRDLKFVRCLDDNCTDKNIAIVDSGGSVGEYTSLALGSGDLGRISYYDSSNGDLKFAQCTNDYCTTKNTNTVDNTSTAGKHNSLVLGTDSFGRISYYGGGSQDLKYVRCVDAACSPPFQQVDLGQSFKPSATNRIVKADLYLKKVGNPANTTLKLITDSSGKPSTSSGNILATGFVNSSQVTSSYGWLSVSFSSTPTLTANTPYWLVLDTTLDNNNYLVWGGDSTDGYSQGTAKRSADLTAGNWQSLNADLDFRVYMGGTDNQISTVSIDGNADAHFLNSVTVGGNANGFTLNSGTVGGSINADTISDCTIGGNASYNIKTNCTVGGNQTTPNTPPADSAHLDMPISQANIDQWKADATTGGTITGDYNVTDNVSLGPKKITGNLNMTASNKTLTVTGTIYVQGNINIDNGSTIKCHSSYGANSCIVLTDGSVHIRNNSVFQGSGTSGSYLMILSTVSGCNGGSQVSPCTHHNAAMDLHNNATGAIFYAQNSMVYIHQGVNVTEITANKLELENNAVVTYEDGLEGAEFTSGPGASYKIDSWQEIP